MRESASEVTVVVAVATALYLVTAPPLMRWARAKHLTPRVVREFPVIVRAAAVNAVVTAAALLFLLTSAPASEATS